MAVQGVSTGAAAETASTRPKRRKIQDEILDQAKKKNPAATTDAPEKTEAETSKAATPKTKRMSIQNELLTYGAGGKPKSGAPAADKSAQSQSVPKERMSIQNEILGYGKNKKTQSSEDQKASSVETTA